MDEQTILRRGIEAKLLLHRACTIYWEQLERGCHVLHENPAWGRSWDGEEMGNSMRDPRVGSVVGDQGQYGQWTYEDEGGAVRCGKPCVG